MLARLFSKDYFQDRFLLVLTVLALIGMSGIVFRIVTTVEQYDFKVATSYTQYGADSFGLGEWYELYSFAAFGLITTIAAVAISARLHRQDRSLSYVVICLQLIILVFLGFVSNALLSASSVVS